MHAREKTFLRLVFKDADPDGWTHVNAAVFHLLKKMPQGLIEDDGGSRVRLTREGKSILRT